MIRSVGLSPLVTMVLMACHAATAGAQTIQQIALQPQNVDAIAITLKWYAPSATDEFGVSYRLDRYDLRYSTSEITDDTWPTAVEALNEMQPGEPGTLETLIMEGLEQNTSYWFAIKGVYGGVESDLSNILQLKTITDTLPPSVISDLKATPLPDGAVKLEWTAPGDDGIKAGTSAAGYDLRFSKMGEIFTVGAFGDATPVAGEPEPLAAGGLQTMTVNGFTETTTYWFAIRAFDEVGNISQLSANSPFAEVILDPGGGGPGRNPLCAAGPAGRWPMAAWGILLAGLLRSRIPRAFRPSPHSP